MKLGLQLARRSIQIAVIAMLVVIPILAHYDNLRAQRDDAGIERRWDTRLVHDAVGGMEHPERITGAIRGSVWSLRVGDRVISDPLAAVDLLCAARTPWQAFVLSALIPLAGTLLLGRVFCGWICPADLLFELGSSMRRWAGIRTDVTFSTRLKYLVLGLGAAAALWLGTQVFAEIYPPRLVGGELYLWITFGAPGAGAWFLLTVLAFEIFVSRRFWCRSLCPGGALYALLGRWRVLRLSVDRVACTDCERCRSACEFGLDPMTGRFGAECNNCGQCARACPPDALSWHVGLSPRDGRDVSRTRGPEAP